MLKSDPNRRKLFLLAIIYMGFVSLGLPDSVLGVAWPNMRLDFARPIESAGLLVTITTVCSVFSSVSYGYISARLSCGVILAVSGLLTMSAMFGYSASASWPVIILLTIPLGIGQGSVDAGLNSYVAKNYSSRHMNWLHCCWGIGATGAPLIMTHTLDLGLSWRTGYAAIAVIQASFTALFFMTLKLWPKEDTYISNAGEASGAARCIPLKPKNFLRNAAAGCVFYFLYPGLEVVAGLWGASFLIGAMNAPIKTAGLTISLFWGSLTAGRLITGAFLSGFTDSVIIRGGLATAGAGILTLATTKNPAVAAAAFAIIGFGLAPLYPSMMHDTPRRVGKEFSERIIGLQVGSAFAGVSILPVLTGYVAARTSLAVVAPIMLCFAAAVAFVHEISATGSAEDSA
jgi:fucose permease